MINLFQVFILSFTVHIHTPDHHMDTFSGRMYYFDPGSCMNEGVSATRYFSRVYKETYPEQRITSEYTCLTLNLTP